MKYTKLPVNVFKNIQLNAGILVDSFDPVTREIGNIIGATSGGVNFTATPEYVDFGDDVDNCPKNVKELKKLVSWEVKMAGSFISVTAELAKTLVAAADEDGSGKVVPRNELLSRDFKDIWWIGDYSNINSDTTEEQAGFCAIHLLNGLSTTGFAIQSTKNGKGVFAFEFTGHYSIDSTDVVPFELFIQEGTEDEYSMDVTSVAGTTTGTTKITISETPGTGETLKYKTGSSVPIPEEGSSVTAYSNWDGTADITATTGNDIVVVILDSNNKTVHAGKTTVVSKA